MSFPKVKGHSSGEGPQLALLLTILMNYAERGVNGCWFLIVTGGVMVSILLAEKGLGKVLGQKARSLFACRPYPVVYLTGVGDEGSLIRRSGYPKRGWENKIMKVVTAV